MSAGEGEDGSVASEYLCLCCVHILNRIMDLEQQQ